MPSRQRTRLAAVERTLAEQWSPLLQGPWGSRAWTLLAILGGFFMASNLLEHVGEWLGIRTLSALALLVICELMVRARDRVHQQPLPLPWQCLDLFRLGLIYGVVLEAFKVGS
ncbi:MAG: DUF565 domain-containing protein [Synechococcus sp.]